MRRGDIVTVSSQGDYGKPRPAVIIQSDALHEADSVLVALFTSAVTDAPRYRLTVTPSLSNGLRSVSQVMVDKVLATPRAKCGAVIGGLSPQEMLALNSMLLVMMGLAD